jgi:hypothetical protein
MLGNVAENPCTLDGVVRLNTQQRVHDPDDKPIAIGLPTFSYAVGVRRCPPDSLIFSSCQASRTYNFLP